MRCVGRSTATHYRRHRTPRPAGPPDPRPRSHRALTDTQVDEILDVLNSERFCDQAPAQIWATLLDEGHYLASVSTMYRILRSQHQVRERRRQARHPAHVKPELVADGPNQVWSWDITKLAGPHKWTWFHLYVILDVYSRYAVGWLVAPRESDRLAERTHRRLRHRREHPRRPTHPPRRPRQLHDLENRRPTPRRPRRHPLPLADPTSPTTTPTPKPNSRP